MQLGIWGHVVSCVSSVGDQGAELLNIYNSYLKTSMIQALRNNKINCLIKNYYYKLKYAQLCLLLSLLGSRMKLRLTV